MSAVLERTVEETEVPTTQTIVLPVKDSLMAGVRPAGAVALATEFTIDCPEMAQMASDQCRSWAQRIDQLSAMEKDFLAPAKKALEDLKGVVAKWLLPARTDLEQGRKVLLAKGLAWTEQEKARLAREQAERDALARRLRQEAEAKAAAERARAEAQAQEARRKEQEAREAHAKALAEGNARAAAAAAAAQAKAAEQAQAAVENGEAKAQAVQLEAAAQVQAAPVAEPVKIAGQSTKTVWEAELKPGVTIDQAKLLIVEAIAGGRHDLLALLDLDTAPRGALNKLAAALKGSMSVPGFVAKATTSIAGSRK